MEYKKILPKVLSAELLAKIFSGVVSILAIRYMQKGVFADYVFALSFFVLVTSTVSSVFNILFIVTEKKKSLQASYFGLQLLLLAVIFIGLSVVSKLFNGLFPYLTVLSTFHVIHLFCLTSFQKDLNFKSYYGFEYVRVLLFTLSFIFLVHYQGDEITAESMLSIQTIATAIPAFIGLFTLTGIKKIFNLSHTCALFKRLIGTENVYLLGYFVVVSILLNIDVFLLRVYSDDSSVAEFGAAFRYYAILQLALISIKKILLPLIAKTNDYARIKEIFSQHKFYSIRLLFLTPVIILGALYVIPVIDRGKYPGSISIFLVLAMSAYCSFCFSPYSNLLIKEKLFKYMFFVILSGFFFHICISVILISRYGAIGAAISNLGSYLLINFSIYKKANSLLIEV